VDAGGDPGVLALSDDGSTLWVALDGTREVLRLSLPGLTPGTRFSTGEDWVEDMEVMPGRPGTVAISLRNDCCSPRHEGVALWDDGVRRARSTPGHSGSNHIAFGESAALLYGFGNETSPTGFYTIQVGGDGVAVARETHGLMTGGGGEVRYAAGRVYGTAGDVADAGRHEWVTTIRDAWAQSSVAVDAALGRVYYVYTTLHGHDLQVFDINTFARLGAASWGGLDSRHETLNPTETLLRWGTDGLALSDGTHIHILRTALAGP
jgi:hypothetical protein